jgi:hypothetical protein
LPIITFSMFSIRFWIVFISFCVIRKNVSGLTSS